MMGNGMDKVLEGLYVGSIRDSTDRKQLDENKITHILCVYSKPRPMISDRVYLCITAQDNSNQELSQHFPECNDFIHQARVNGGHILVHCLAGVSRSVTLVIAYMMSVTNYTWRESYNIVHAAHRASSPNFGFQRQLLRFQYEQISEERERMKKKWPPSPYDDDVVCKKWLAIHDNWVQGGDKVAYESTVYPLPYNSFSVQTKASDGLATNLNTASEDGRTCTVGPYPEEDKTSTLETSDSREGSTDSKQLMLRSVQIHRSQPCKHGGAPDVISMTSLNELFQPSPSFVQGQVSRLKCSSRTMEHQKRDNTCNNSSKSECMADEGSNGHMTSDIPEAFSENCNESESSDKTTLDDLFADPLG